MLRHTSSEVGCAVWFLFQTLSDLVGAHFGQHAHWIRHFNVCEYISVGRNRSASDDIAAQNLAAGQNGPQATWQIEETSKTIRPDPFHSKESNSRFLFVAAPRILATHRF